MWSSPIMKRDGKAGLYEDEIVNSPNSIHIIADFCGCDKSLLTSGSKGEEILATVVAASGLSCVLIRYHQFEPQGYTAAALLTESHITLHSWPEHESVQIDIFTCGSHSKARAAYEKLKEIFAPESVAEKILFRNLHQISPEKK